MGQVLAIEHAPRIDRLVLSATWAKTDAFFRRLFEVRALMLRELGAEAYTKSSALALNMPSWIRDHDADLVAAEARAKETIPEPEIVLSRIAAIVAHDQRDRLQKVTAPTLAICARDDMVTPLYFTEELVRLVPNDVEAHAYGGWIVRLAGLPDEGLARIQRAVDLDASYPDAHFFREAATDRRPEPREAGRSDAIRVASPPSFRTTTRCVRDWRRSSC